MYTSDDSDNIKIADGLAACRPQRPRRRSAARSRTCLRITVSPSPSRSKSRAAPGLLACWVVSVHVRPRPCMSVSDVPTPAAAVVQHDRDCGLDAATEGTGHRLQHCSSVPVVEKLRRRRAVIFFRLGVLGRRNSPIRGPFGSPASDTEGRGYQSTTSIPSIMSRNEHPTCISTATALDVDVSLDLEMMHMESTSRVLATNAQACAASTPASRPPSSAR